MKISLDQERIFVDRCVKAGLKVTRQRREIYLLLAMDESHPDAEHVYKLVRKKIPNISLDTVYRNLRTLEENGIIQKAGATGYRTRFDAKMEPHYHFVCTRCGRISDFCSDELDGYESPPEVKRMGSVKTVYVELRGLCSKCSGNKRK